MCTPERGSRHTERGSVMAMALAFSAVVGSMIVAAISVAIILNRSTETKLDQTGALAIAEGVAERAQKQMLEDVANFTPPTTEGDFQIGGQDVRWYANPIGNFIYRTDPDGVQSSIQPYEITVSSQVDRGFANLSRVVDLTMTPLFQYMIFYDDDLEILPGPSMQLEGRVHANGSIYVGAGNTLTVDTDYFRGTGQILRERKNNGTTTGGTVDIRRQGTTDFVEMSNDMDANHTDWTQMALSNWDGTVQDGSHGVSEVVSPNLGTIQVDGYYHDNADLVIIDDQAFDADGNPISLPAGTLTEVSMYDGREGQYITVTEIDIELLNSSGAFPENGLLYAYRTDTTTEQPNGIRLANGEELAGPLTVVTEDPIYVQGDYNAINKQGAAVISDAVNLLSNDWDDSKGPGDLPHASDTDYNLAMITGNVRTPDGGGSYSGGFENLPRFHERWSGVRARIRGAFANLYESVYARSPWRYGGDVYRAPIRDWRYDPDLLDPNNLPPFTPNVAYIRRVLWDDQLPVQFRFDLTGVPFPPDTPIYDPWVYDPSFMDLVLPDPNQ